MDGRVWVIGAFLAVLTVVGAWFARRIKTAEDFALAGRGLGVPVLAGTLVATWIGTGSLFGNAEFTVTHGFAGFLLPLSSVLGILALAVLAPLARAVPAQTVPQILGVRFGTSAQKLGAVTLIGAYLIIVSYQYRAGAAFASVLFPGVHEDWLIVAFALFVTLFTVLAGMFSVAFTDVVCGAIMTIGLLVAAGLVMRDWNATGATLPETARDLGAGQDWVFWVGVMLPPLLLILGDANMHQRFLSARTPGTARTAALLMLIGVLVVDWAIIAIALYGTRMLEAPPINAGYAVVYVAFDLMPAGLGLLIAAAALSVIISTADSYLLASAVSAAGDFSERLRAPRWQRGLVVVLGVGALGPAFMSDEFFRVALYAYTLYGASLTPAILLALLRPHTAPQIAISGMAAGLAVAVLWKLWLWVNWLPETLARLDPVLPALAANAAAMGIAALVLQRLGGRGA